MYGKKKAFWKRLFCLLIVFSLVALQIPSEKVEASEIVSLIGGIPKVNANIVKGGSDKGANQYTSAWQYWSQGASRYAAMYFGCRVTSYAKMLAEAGCNTFGNPDGFFEWGRGVYFRSSDTRELQAFGAAPINYIKNKGGSASMGSIG